MCIRENALNRVTELCFPNSYTIEEVYRELYLIIGHLYEELQTLYDNVTSRAINRIFDYSSNMFMGLCESFAIEALTEPEIDINSNRTNEEWLTDLFSTYGFTILYFCLVLENI